MYLQEIVLWAGKISVKTSPWKTAQKISIFKASNNEPSFARILSAFYQASCKKYMMIFYHEMRFYTLFCIKISVIIITRITMESTKEYLDFVLEQLSLLDDISYKSMMGEYILMLCLMNCIRDWSTAEGVRKQPKVVSNGAIAEVRKARRQRSWRNAQKKKRSFYDQIHRFTSRNKFQRKKNKISMPDLKTALGEKGFWNWKEDFH